VKRLTVIVILAILLARLTLFGLSDTAVSSAHTNIPTNEVTSSAANNSSATATITITMTGALNE
jgi:hypothetical protein